MEEFLDGEPPPGESSLVRIQQEIPLLLVKAIAAGNTSAEAVVPRRRDRAVRRAEAYITEHEDEPLTVRDVCLASQVSERTLQYGFLEHFGVTPKAYLRAIRLKGVHRELKSARAPDAKINEIAALWGFWHVGQYAADYREQFGELPSQTVLTATR
jgi:AraC family ethanolamine operon transcriptional activator